MSKRRNTRRPHLRSNGRNGTYKASDFALSQKHAQTTAETFTHLDVVRPTLVKQTTA